MLCINIYGEKSSHVFFRYVDYLVDTNSSTTLTIQGVEFNASEIRENLRTSINNVYNDVIMSGEIDASGHPEERAIYANEGQFVNGNSYGVVLNHVSSCILYF